MTRNLGSLFRHASFVSVLTLVAGLAPWTAYGESTLQTVIEQIGLESQIQEDWNFDSLLQCILEEHGEQQVADSFRQHTGLSLEKFNKLLQLRSSDSWTLGNDSNRTGPEGEGKLSLRDGSYENYDLKNAVLLGLAPYTNPRALSTVGTGYAVPVQAILSNANNSERKKLLDGLIDGRIAATHYTATGIYRRVGPSDSGWHDLIAAVQNETWTVDTIAHWNDDHLIVETGPRETDEDELRLIAVDDSLGESGIPVIAWNAGRNVEDLVQADYSRALYRALVETGSKVGCGLALPIAAIANMTE